MEAAGKVVEGKKKAAARVSLLDLYLQSPAMVQNH